jgi:hypothetical protein
MIPGHGPCHCASGTCNPSRSSSTVEGEERHDFLIQIRHQFVVCRRQRQGESVSLTNCFEGIFIIFCKACCSWLDEGGVSASGGFYLWHSRFSLSNFVGVYFFFFRVLSLDICLVVFGAFFSLFLDSVLFTYHSTRLTFMVLCYFTPFFVFVPLQCVIFHLCVFSFTISSLSLNFGTTTP